ncbi:Fe-S-containing hydro-lyase [bacterium]|nr:Fe-S-containing hydro-lyase [bacterium]
MSESKKITTPLSDEVVKSLHAGDWVRISGILYTGRDAAHKRLVETLDLGKDLPFDIHNQIIYYTGPTPAKPGKSIGSIGPTTSYRMDPFTPKLVAFGLKGMIGKGNRSQAVITSLKKYKAVYFGAIGGTAALLAKSVVHAEMIAYEDLGPEAIRKLEVEDFPALVVNDCHGGDLYIEGIKRYRLD